jgi:sodium transport system permease protein
MIWHVFRKELKDSFRDQTTLLLSVFLPIVFITGLLFYMEKMAMDDTNEEIKVAVSVQTNSKVLSWLKEVKGLKLVTSDNPLKLIEDGGAHAAFFSDPDFTDKLNSNTAPTITIQADPTSSKGGTAQDKIEDILNIKKNELVQSRLAKNQIEPNVIEPFQIQTKSLTDSDDTSLYFISIFAQLIIVMSVLMGGMAAANDLFAGEKERKTMEALLMTPVNRLHLIVGKWLAIAVLSMISGVFSVVSFIVGVNVFTEKLKTALQLDQNIGFFTISLLAGIIFFALLISSLQMIISLLANTMKEAQNFITPITFIAMIPYFVLIGTSANELTKTYFMIPFLNIYALIKQLIYGIYDVTSILLVVGSSSIFIALSFFVAYGMFKKSRWVLGK